MSAPRVLDPAVAHELRAPLAALMGVIDLLASGEGGLDASDRRELLVAAREEVGHVLSMVEQARTGALSGAAETVRIADVASRALERFPSVERRTYLRLDRGVVAQVSPSVVDQILTNLFQNVERYAPDGDVEVRMGREGSQVWVVVSDSGPGVAYADPESVFNRAPSTGVGLGVGLGLSRELARVAGGDLDLVESAKGASFRLRLPAEEVMTSGTARTIVPRARVLVELADALSRSSLAEVEVGIHRIATDIFGATTTCLLRSAGDRLLPITDRHDRMGIPLICPAGRSHASVDHVGECPEWTSFMNAPGGRLVPLATGSAPGFYVAIGYDSDVRPGNDEAVLDAFARVAALAVDRAVLTTELREERSVRASVLESLPIAISIFRGDPPIVVDWNAAERRMLGLGEDVRRPTDLAESQQQFNVRFADGTPVSIDNAPVTKAIRHGVKTGPILLRVTREDGVEIMTRTYCSPFRDDSGKVVGAVVTSDVVSGSVNLEA